MADLEHLLKAHAEIPQSCWALDGFGAIQMCRSQWISELRWKEMEHPPAAGFYPGLTGMSGPESYHQQTFGIFLQFMGQSLEPRKVVHFQHPTDAAEVLQRNAQLDLILRILGSQGPGQSNLLANPSS